MNIKEYPLLYEGRPCRLAGGWSWEDDYFCDRHKKPRTQYGWVRAWSAIGNATVKIEYPDGTQERVNVLKLRDSVHRVVFE